MKKYLAYGLALMAGISLNLSFTPAISGIANNSQVVQACSAKVTNIDPKEQIVLNGSNRGKYETDLTFFAKKSNKYDLVINYFDKNGKQVGKLENPAYIDKKGSKYTYNDKQLFNVYVASAQITFVKNHGCHSGDVKASFPVKFAPVKIPAPVISGADNLSIGRREALGFDPYRGVSANDAFDGDITSKIVLSGQLELVPGKNVLVYSVMNSNGLSTTVERVINVATE